MADQQGSDNLKPLIEETRKRDHTIEQRRPPRHGVDPDKSKERQTEVPPEASRRQGARQSDKSSFRALKWGFLRALRCRSFRGASAMPAGVGATVKNGVWKNRGGILHTRGRSK